MKTLCKRYRPARHYHFRLYLGGEFDGLKEQVPMSTKTAGIRPVIRKQEWRGERLMYNHEYTLSEPVTRAATGATYIYQTTK